MTLAETGTRVGEVVEASTVELTAQCYRLDGAPPFGSLVRVTDGTREIYAIVARVSTGSLDAGRRVTPRGAEERDEAALFEHNPELAALLRTELHALVVGFRDQAGAVLHRLPPHPPRLHGFVHACDAAELRAFTERLDYLATLASTTARVPADELIGATLRQAAAVRETPRSYLVAAGKHLAGLLGNDIRRLSTILRVAREEREASGGRPGSPDGPPGHGTASPPRAEARPAANETSGPT